MDWDTLTEFRTEIERLYPTVELMIMPSPSHGYVILDRIVIPKSERKMGLGTAVMRELVRWADHNHVTLALTPDTAHGATSTTRLTRFYRRFGFIPNTGRRKDSAVREAMIRPL